MAINIVIGIFFSNAIFSFWIFFITIRSQLRETTMLKPMLEVIKNLYKMTNGMELSLAERDRLDISDSTFTYGEINPSSFAEMLQVAEPKPGEIFYDLGSGTGKAVFCAALLYDWQALRGIEFLPALHQTSVKLLKSLPNLPEIKKYYPNKAFPIEFIQKDFLNYDFSDADIIYIHATTFGYPLWDNLGRKLQQLRPGARVIVNTKQLDPEYFNKIDETTYLMGWGESTVFTFKKKENLH